MGGKDEIRNVYLSKVAVIYEYVYCIICISIYKWVSLYLHTIICKSLWRYFLYYYFRRAYRGPAEPDLPVAAEAEDSEDGGDGAPRLRDLLLTHPVPHGTRHHQN